MAYLGNNLDSDIQVNKYTYTATQDQTTFVCTYDRAVDVYVNGLKISKDDFTATSGVDIVLDSGLNAGDVVDINAYFDVTYGGYDDSQIDGLLAAKADVATTYTKAEVDTAIAENAGAGATGGGSDEIFFENGQTITTSYTITSGKNAMTAGDITIATGVTVTVPSGSRWVIV